MKILVCPEDLIKRCVWDHYVYYVLGSDKEGERILKENNEFEIDERSAVVIGLLKVIETENLIHKFNTCFLYFSEKEESFSPFIHKKILFSIPKSLILFTKF
jgi:hypothetical protein